MVEVAQTFFTFSYDAGGQVSSFVMENLSDVEVLGVVNAIKAISTFNSIQVFRNIQTQDLATFDLTQNPPVWV